jgi:hypothetical protein
VLSHRIAKPCRTEVSPHTHRVPPATSSRPARAGGHRAGHPRRAQGGARTARRPTVRW